MTSELKMNVSINLTQDTSNEEFEFAYQICPTVIDVSGKFTLKMAKRLYDLVTLRSSNLEQVTISNTKIKPEVAKYLAKMLRDTSNRPLKLCFENCKVDKTAFRKIFKFPAKVISELSFINCGIDDQMLCCLPQLSGTTSINLTNNKITEQGATFLNEWLENNLDLKTLIVTGNHISKKLNESLIEHLADNHAIANYLKHLSDNKDGLDLSELNLKEDKHVVRRLCKLLGHKDISKIVLPSTVTFTAQEQLELEKAIVKHATLIAVEDKNGKSLLPAKSNAQKLLDQNALNKEIMHPSSLLGKVKSEGALLGGVLSFVAGVIFMFANFAEVNSPASAFVTYVSTLVSLPHLTLFIVGFCLCAAVFQALKYNADFKDKLNLLKDKTKWEESDRKDFEMGAQCTKSFAPYFSLQSYTPAGYLGYQAAKAGKLDIVPEKGTVQPKVN